MIVIKKEIAEKFFDEEDKLSFKKWLLEKDLTIGEACYKMGYSYSYVYLIINGKKPVTYKFVKKLREIGYEM